MVERGAGRLLITSSVASTMPGAQGFEALMAGQERVVAGSLMNKFQAMAGRFVPDRLKAKMHARMAEPGSGDGPDDAA
jgi:hypothetical protein